MSQRRTFCGCFLDPRGSLGVGHIGVFGKPADDAKSGLGDLPGLEIAAGAKQNCLEGAMARRRLSHAVTHAAPKSVLLSIVLFVVIGAQSLNRAVAKSIDFRTLFPASAVVEDEDKRRQRVNVRALARMVAQTDPLKSHPEGRSLQRSEWRV